MQSERVAQVALTNQYSPLQTDEDGGEEQLDSIAGPDNGRTQVNAYLGRGHRLMIVARGRMDDVQCDDMLVDTGASCCFVRRSWAESMKLPITPLKERVTVSLADKRKTESTHGVSLKRMAIHGSAEACTLLVMDELSNDVIVGLDWQRAGRISIQPRYPHDLLNGRPVAKAQAGGQQPVTGQSPVSHQGVTGDHAAGQVGQPPSEPVRLYAALVHQIDEAQLSSGRAEVLRSAIAGQQSTAIDAAAAGNEQLRRVLQRHQHVFTEVLPVKTAEQIAAAKKFSIVLVGDSVRPVKQRERRMSPAEIKAATEWVQEEVAAGRMEPSSGQWAAQLVIVPKRNEKGEVTGWRICGDYRSLNDVTKADAEPLPLMDMVFDQLAGMQYFSKLDLLKGFNQIPVDARSRELMAVSTPVGLYQPTVMPFGVKNAPGTFQREMRRVLNGRLNKGVFVFIDDIIIYSRGEAEHLELIDWVLTQLTKAGYYAHPGKCQFLKSEVNFLGHVVGRAGVSMQKHKVEAVRSWPQLKSPKDVRAFLGLAGFYRRFVKGFSEIAKPLTDLTHVAADIGWDWGTTEQKAFDKLKQAMVSAPVLAHADPYQPWMVQTDASGYAIGAVLSQKQKDGTVRPVAYWSKKLSGAPRNYSATERELMAIVEATQHWRSYLHGSPYPIQLLSDHKPLMYLNSKAELGQRLAKWMEQLCDFTFEIKYVKGRDNAAADALSRRSDHEPKGSAEPAPAGWKVKLIDRKAARTSESLASIWAVAGDWMDEPRELLTAVQRKSATRAAQPAEAKTAESKTADSGVTEHHLRVESLLTDIRAAVERDERYQLMLKGDEKHDKLQRRDGLVYSRSGAVYIPSDRRLRTRLLELAHDAVGHFGRDRTLQRLSQHCLWEGMSKEVEDWCRSCQVCCTNKSSNDLPAGLLKPLPVPESVWDSVGVDFVGPLPKSKAGHDYILVLIDRFSKMLKMRACSQKITGVQTGRLLLEMMFDIGKLPSSIVSDRDVRFTGAAWGQLWRGLKTELKMSTAYHPQTDGQTERMNRTLQTVLRSYAERREDWEEWLPFVAAAYNSTQQESTKRTPFELNFPDRRSIDPLQWALKEMPTTANGRQQGVSVEAERTIDEMKVIWEETRLRLVNEQARQKKYADQKRREVRYKRGDSVWLSTSNLPSMRGKLQDKWVGPYEVMEVMSAGTSVRLDLRGELGKTHPTFHVSRVKPYEASEFQWPGRLQANRPVPELIEGELEWEVEAIIGKKTIMEDMKVKRLVDRPGVKTRTGRVSKPTQSAQQEVTTTERVPVVYYRVLWKGWGEDDASWMKDSDLSHSRELIDAYELLVKQSSQADGQKAGAAVVELGVATVVQCSLQDKQSTARRGKPTVRCAYLRAGQPLSVTAGPSVSTAVAVGAQPVASTGRSTVV